MADRIRLPLEYAGPIQKVRTEALPAMICGLCCGPVGWGLAYLCGALCSAGHCSESTELIAVVAAFVTTTGWGFVFGCFVLKDLPAAAPVRDRVFAILGVVAPIGWAIAIMASILVTV